MGKDSATGSFRLFVGKIVSTVTLAISTIILTVFILESDYGLYSIALVPSTTIILFQDWGVGSAIIKYCAQFRAENRTGELRKIIIAGLTFEAATGFALALLLLAIANFLASVVFGTPESAFLITLTSITVLSTALLTATQSIFVGFERMGLNSLTMICQAATQGVLSTSLVYLGYGATGAVLGFTFSSLATSIIALAMVYFAIYKKTDPAGKEDFSIFRTLKPMLTYGIPLALASILAGLLPQFYWFIMASVVDFATIGNYRVAINFAVLLTFFTIPISTVLFPAFSKLNSKTDQQLLKTVFASSVKYTTLFLVPATMALIVLSKPLIGTIYADKWLSAPLFLSLYVVGNLFAVLGSSSIWSLFSGLGDTTLLMKLNVLTLSVGVPLGFVLIPQLGVIGAILAALVSGIPSMVIGLYLAWKRYDTKADFGATAKIFLASTIAAASTYFIVVLLNVATWVSLAVGIVIYLSAFLVVAPLIGAINQKDIDNLRAMFSGLGIVSKILEIPLGLLQKMLRLRHVSENQFRTPTTK
ncbi:MAG: oligosaccharide flippase family protein [Candidatus Bathyarchaeota archaeon]|nr:oligosaccharide flippase family protein [Candidatus Bathyarchaeota archaeon]